MEKAIFMSKALIDKITDLINRERTRLEKERDFYRQKLRETETMDWYGCGGPYARQEAALKKREEELKALDDFAYQLRHAEDDQPEQCPKVTNKD